jgi:peptidoglycan/LPS O-acetylase OafA/YrhL
MAGHKSAKQSVQQFFFTMKSPEKRGGHFLYEIEGLRGILAMWVFISHLMWGSGFVIFLLLDSTSDSYLQYITKRFFRLYPIFIITSVFGAILFLLHLGVLGGNYHGPNVFVRSPEYYADQTKILILHSLMFQGFLSDLGPIVLNPPSWSISLEWQFYLIAPILFFLLRKWMVGTSLFLVIAAIVKNLVHPTGIINAHGATLLDQIIPFTVGMLCYKIYQQRHLCQNPIFIETLIIFLLLGLLFCCQSFILSIFTSQNQVVIPSSIPLLIWTIVFFSIIARTCNPELFHQNIISRYLRHPLLQFLGKISYSLYLIHQLVIFVFLLFLGSFVLTLKPVLAFFLECGIIIPITLAISYAANVLVEQPFIGLGKKMVK